MPESSASKVPHSMYNQSLLILTIGSLSTSFTWALGPFLVHYTINPSDIQSVGSYSGLLSSVHLLGRAIGWPILSYLCMDCGRRPLISICLLISLCFTFFFSLNSSFIIALVIRFVGGLAGSYSSLTRNAIKDITNDNIEQYQSMSQRALTLAGLSSTIGIFIGGFLCFSGTAHPLFLPVLLVALLEAAAFFVSLIIEETYISPPKRPVILQPLEEAKQEDNPMTERREELEDNSMPSYLNITGLEMPSDEDREIKQFSPTFRESKVLQPTLPMSARPGNNRRFFRMEDEEEDEIYSAQQQDEPAKRDKHMHISFIEEDFQPIASPGDSLETEFKRQDIPLIKNKAVLSVGTIRALSSLAFGITNESIVFLILLVFSEFTDMYLKISTSIIAGGYFIGFSMHRLFTPGVINFLGVLKAAKTASFVLGVIVIVFPICLYVDKSLGALCLLWIVFSVWKMMEQLFGTCIYLMSSDSVCLYQKHEVEIITDEIGLIFRAIGAAIGPMMLAVFIHEFLLPPFLVVAFLLWTACLFTVFTASQFPRLQKHK